MTTTPEAGLPPPEAIEAARQTLSAVRAGLATTIFGQDTLLDRTVIALAARGHILLEGLPGLGKTELVKRLAELLGLEFRRVQFTPDLLPADITGGPVLEESAETGRRDLVFRPGPVFSNLLLADEINRASPKTQSALLEAMQERHVTVLGDTHPLPRPFFVLATQNPIELEGTYALPEAQLDRFLFRIEVPSVDADVLTRILTEPRGGDANADAASPHDAQSLDHLFGTVEAVFLPHPVARYIARIVANTHAAEGPLSGAIRHGASPRGALAIAAASRASAVLAGRPNVDFDDVDSVAVPALAHRIVLDHGARIEGRTGDDVIAEVVAATPVLEDTLPQGVR